MENVKAFLLDNMDVLKSAVQQLNAWNGCMDHLDVYENEEDFFDSHFYNKPMAAVRAAQYGEYCFTDEYVRFDGYGNLESLDEDDYHAELEQEIDVIIGHLQELYGRLELDGELDQLLVEAEENDN